MKWVHFSYHFYFSGILIHCNKNCMVFKVHLHLFSFFNKICIAKYTMYFRTWHMSKTNQSCMFLNWILQQHLSSCEYVYQKLGFFLFKKMILKYLKFLYKIIYNHHTKRHFFLFVRCRECVVQSPKGWYQVKFERHTPVNSLRIENPKARGCLLLFPLKFLQYCQLLLHTM